MRHFFVPCQTFNVIDAGSGGITQSKGIFDVFDVVDEKLTLCASCGEDLRLQWVELNGLDGTAVLGGAFDVRVRSSSCKLLSIPKI